MSFTRRGVLGAAATATAATAIGAHPARAQAPGGSTYDPANGPLLLPRKRIGIQLYTVRDQVAALGFAEVLRRLRAMGYREIEFAGYNAQGRRWSNQELKALLRRNGLRGIGSHVNYFSANPAGYSFVTQLEQVLQDAKEIGLPYIGTASSPGARYGETVDGYKRAAEDFNRFGAAARALGMRFYQHNHSGEFAIENGTRLYDVILAETDPDLVFFELDLFWAYVGQDRFPGFKPTDYLWNHPLRFPLLHVKDGIETDTGPFFGWIMTDVGDGDVPLEEVLQGLNPGLHHFIVERDTAVDPVVNPAGSFATAERSYDYLSRLRVRGPR